MRASRAEQLVAVPPANHESCSRAAVADRAGVDAVEVLEVAADVGVAVLQRLGRGDARDARHRVAQAGGEAARRRRAEHDVGAVREAGVRLGLLPVGGVEGRRGRREARGQGDQRERARDRGALLRACSKRRSPELARERARDRARSRSDHAEGEFGEPVGEQCDADPCEQRSQERPVVDRRLRAALCDEHELRPAAARRAVDEAAPAIASTSRP